jgi:hypothetical protein
LRGRLNESYGWPKAILKSYRHPSSYGWPNESYSHLNESYGHLKKSCGHLLVLYAGICLNEMVSVMFEWICIQFHVSWDCLLEPITTFLTHSPIWSTLPVQTVSSMLFSASEA